MVRGLGGNGGVRGKGKKGEEWEEGKGEGKEWEEGNLSKPKHVKQGLIPLVMHSWYNLADAWQKHLLFVFLVLVLG